nr:MAG TPA: hypothetical protein [Caudoviricetes sp.]
MQGDCRSYIHYNTKKPQQDAEASTTTTMMSLLWREGR